MEQMTNIYPVGIQTFSEIIQGGYVYIDKTDLIWDLTHYAKFIFMSRPRRFGKSLLTSTIESYFSGDRTLFKGLKIEGLEKEWSQYPVIHLDLSVAKGQTDASELRETLMWMMQPFADLYGHKDNETSPGKLLTGVIKRASEKAGTQVVVVIDEYDAPLLDVLHGKDVLDGMRKVMQHFHTDIMSLDRIEVPDSAFDRPTENMEDALPLLYQSGYLTIKDYDRMTQIYTLAIPNQEVRVGYVNGSAADALRQIDSKGYAIPYKADGRRVVKVGVSFNKETRTVDDWIVEE